MARSTLVRHRNLFSRDPEEGGGGGGNTEDAGKEGGQGNPPKTFTQEDLDRIVGERLNRQKAQFADYDELKRKAAEAETLRKQVETDAEKAVREAREAAVAEERAKSAPRLVGAEFRAAAKGVLTDAQRDAFLEDADLTKYLTATGEVDVAKVEAKVKALAPEKETKTTNTRVPRDLGQGNREGQGKPSVSSAKDDYLERRRKQIAAASA
jgi:hypothetical protein